MQNKIITLQNFISKHAKKIEHESRKTIQKMCVVCDLFKSEKFQILDKQTRRGLSFFVSRWTDLFFFQENSFDQWQPNSFLVVATNSFDK